MNPEDHVQEFEEFTDTYQRHLTSKTEVQTDMVLRKYKPTTNPPIMFKILQNQMTQEPEPLLYKLQILPGKIIYF